MPAAAALTRLVQLESPARISLPSEEGVVGELCRMLVARVSDPDARRRAEELLAAA